AILAAAGTGCGFSDIVIGQATSGTRPTGTGSTGGSATSGGSTNGGSCLRATPDPLDFGETPVGTKLTRNLTLTNTCPSEIGRITETLEGSDADLFQLGSLPATLAARGSAQTDVTYGPLQLQTRSFANVVFTGSAGDGGQTREEMTLSLYGQPIGVGLSPNPCDFGYVPLNASTLCCSRLTNQGTTAATIVGIGDFSNAGGAFGISATDDSQPPKSIAFPLVVPAGAAARVCFTLSPTASQQYQGQATLDTAQSPSGANPVLQLAGWGGGPQIQCDPNSLAFGTVRIGTSEVKTVKCTNQGTAIPIGTNLLIGTLDVSP